MVKNISLSAALAMFIMLSIHRHAAAPVDVNTATAKRTKERMPVTGGADLGLQITKNILPAFKKMLPDLPDPLHISA